MNLVVHCKKSKHDVYIGRPSKWGNQPFFVLADGLFSRCHFEFSDGFVKMREWMTQPELVAAAKQELKNKVLGCWCSPLSCHGDVLARIANED